MEDLWRPIIRYEYYVVRQPAIDANNFELKPALIVMVQQHCLLVIPVQTPMSIWVDF